MSCASGDAPLQSNTTDGGRTAPAPAPASSAPAESAVCARSRARSSVQLGREVLQGARPRVVDGGVGCRSRSRPRIAQGVQVDRAKAAYITRAARAVDDGAAVAQLREQPCQVAVRERGGTVGRAYHHVQARRARLRDAARGRGRTGRGERDVPPPATARHHGRHERKTSVVVVGDVEAGRRRSPCFCLFVQIVSSWLHQPQCSGCGASERRVYSLSRENPQKCTLNSAPCSLG